MRITYGNSPVPWTVSWSDEFPYFVDRCPHARMPAIRQPQHYREDRAGQKPDFGNPNFDRQRQAIVQGLCDLCARPLRGRTMVSLSHARERENAVVDRLATGVLQVEPMLHRECALTCMQHCPALRRDIAAGTLQVRHVTRWRAQLAIMMPEAIETHVPSYTGPRDGIVGLAKVELLQWTDRDADWLGAHAAAA